MNNIDAYFQFSPRILDHLGITAYNSVQKCVGELVANSYDADAADVHVRLPDTVDENAVLEIADTGCGMSPDEVSQKFLFIGRNRRGEGQRTEGGRLVIGSKGIGKLAGFGVASKLELLSWKDGIQSTLTIDRSQLDDLEALSKEPLHVLNAPSARHNGTTIRLLGLNDGLHLPTSDVLRRYLFRSLPRVPGFRILVNDVECTAEDVLGERADFQEQIEGLGTVKGFYVVANVRQQPPGLATRVRGRIVQEPDLFGLDTRTHGFFTAERLIGEINAEFLDPEESQSGHGDLINTTRDGFVSDSPVVKKFEAWAEAFLRKIILGIDEKETKKRTDALLAHPDVKQRLDRLPPHVRSTATKVVRALLGKLKSVGDSDASELVEWILRYYESNVLRELMQAILAEDTAEAEKLAELVQQWGLKQVTSVVDIIKTQIEIIGKLEELVASQAAKEIDLHKLIESNLWLVREGLELWSSDKPLKTVLDGKLDEIYKVSAPASAYAARRAGERSEGGQAVSSRSNEGSMRLGRRASMSPSVVAFGNSVNRCRR